MSRELLFSVTAKDLEFNYSRGSGKGGQKRNKTSSKVQCVHKASGAMGISDDTRSQHKNKRIAFIRMAESTKFKNWHRIEVARRMGREHEIKEAVDIALHSSNIKVEGKNEQGQWVQI